MNVRDVSFNDAKKLEQIADQHEGVFASFAAGTAQEALDGCVQKVQAYAESKGYDNIAILPGELVITNGETSYAYVPALLHRGDYQDFQFQL